MQQKTPLAQMSKRRLELTAEITHPLKSVPDTFYSATQIANLAPGTFIAPLSYSATQIANLAPGTFIAPLSELPELGQLNRGQIAKLVGVAPIAKDSGKKQGKRATFAGRAMIRKVLYMAALVATRYNPAMKRFYQRLLAKGKPKKVALVAVMRKLLVTLNTMVKNNEPWSERKLALK